MYTVKAFQFCCMFKIVHDKISGERNLEGKINFSQVKLEVPVNSFHGVTQILEQSIH